METIIQQESQLITEIMFDHDIKFQAVKALENPCNIRALLCLMARDAVKKSAIIICNFIIFIIV